VAVSGRLWTSNHYSASRRQISVTSLVTSTHAYCSALDVNTLSEADRNRPTDPGRGTGHDNAFNPSLAHLHALPLSSALATSHHFGSQPPWIRFTQVQSAQTSEESQWPTRFISPSTRAYASR